MLQVKELQKIFRVGGNEVAALGGVTQGVEEGEFFVLLGPSGSGKTTLLRCVAGLETPDGGEIEIDGSTVFSTSQGISAPPEDRKIGMVFQSYAIWPHMTVFQNVALPLTRGRKKIDRSLVRERVHESLKLVQLEDYAERPSPLLSGGPATAGGAGARPGREPEAAAHGRALEQPRRAPAGRDAGADP